MSPLTHKSLIYRTGAALLHVRCNCVCNGKNWQVTVYTFKKVRVQETDFPNYLNEFSGGHVVNPSIRSKSFVEQKQVNATQKGVKSSNSNKWKGIKSSLGSSYIIVFCCLVQCRAHFVLMHLIGGPLYCKLPHLLLHQSVTLMFLEVPSISTSVNTLHWAAGDTYRWRNKATATGRDRNSALASFKTMVVEK